MNSRVKWISSMWNWKYGWRFEYVDSFKYLNRLKLVPIFAFKNTAQEGEMSIYSRSVSGYDVTFSLRLVRVSPIPICYVILVTIDRELANVIDKCCPVLFSWYTFFLLLIVPLGKYV